MSATETYSAVHAAIRATAKERGLEGYAVRVALALAEHGPVVSSDDLEAILSEEGSAIRRALLTLYGQRLARATGADGGPRRPGVRSQITLTPAGERIAATVQRRIAAIEAARASEDRRAAA